MLFRLFFNSNQNILKFFLALIIKTYTENLTLLVHIPQHQVELVNNLMSQFH